MAAVEVDEVGLSEIYAEPTPFVHQVIKSIYVLLTDLL